MTTGTMFFLILMGIALVLIQVLMMLFAFGNRSEDEMKELNQKRVEWANKHPFLTLLLFLIPTPISLIIETKLIHPKNDDREINHSTAEKEIQYPSSNSEPYQPLPMDEKSQSGQLSA